MLNLRIPLYEGDGYLRVPKEPIVSVPPELLDRKDEDIDLKACLAM